jgi:putative membrane protein
MTAGDPHNDGILDDELTDDETTEEVLPQDELTCEEPSTDSEWRGLHPLSLVANLAPRTWRTLRGTWPLLAAFAIGGRRDSVAILFIAALFFGMAVWSTVLHFLTLRYRVVHGRLEMRSGLLNRQVRSLDPSRIQNTELVRNPLHKILGLVELRVETASGREVEGLLSALSEEEGERLLGLLDAARARSKRAKEEEEEEEAKVLASADLADLLRYGATGLRVGAGIAIAVGLGMEALQFLDPEQYERVPSLVGRVGGAAAVIAFVSGLFLVAVAGAVQRFWRFSLTLSDGRLVASQGLFTKRRIQLELSKVQLATVRQPWSKRLLQFASVHVETAAAHVGDGGTASAEAIIPVVHTEDIATLLAEVIPHADTVWDSELHPPHPRALRRGILSAIIEGLLIGALIGAWFGGWAWVFLLIAPIVDVLFAWFDHRHQGWRVTEHLIIARSGYLNRRTHVVSRKKIQSITLRQGPILRRWDLAKVVIRVAGSRVDLPLLSAAEARHLVDTLTPLGRPVTVDASSTTALSQH